MQEVWKDIPGYSGYQASNLGNVRSLNYRRTGVSRQLKILVARNGYKQISTRINGKNKRLYVHRLVASAFLNDEGCDKEVNHKNGDKADNRVTNLEYVTPKENMNHYWRVLRNKPYFLKSGRSATWRNKPVMCVETGEKFPSIAAAARSIGVCDKAISQLLSNPSNRHTAGGFHWKTL